MGVSAFATVIIVTLVAGILVQNVSRTPRAYEWLIVTLAAAFGAIFASESFPGSAVFAAVADWGPMYDGLAVIPALIGGILMALVADIGIHTGREPRTA